MFPGDIRRAHPGHRARAGGQRGDLVTSLVDVVEDVPAARTG
jgi:hypothetical protein